MAMKKASMAGSTVTRERAALMALRLVSPASLRHSSCIFLLWNYEALFIDSWGTEHCRYSNCQIYAGCCPNYAEFQAQHQTAIIRQLLSAKFFQDSLFRDCKSWLLSRNSGSPEVELRFCPWLICSNIVGSLTWAHVSVPIMCLHRGARPKVRLRWPDLRLNTPTQND